MEITCTRCHQTVQADNLYCPACGLPQLVYSADGAPLGSLPEHGPEAPRDASTVEWKTALRLAVMLSIPAGFLCSGVSPLGIFGLFWMAAAAAWVVALYMRHLKPAWITIGAGARMGLVTGLLGGWMAFGISGGALFVQRYVFHQGGEIDGTYKTLFLDRVEEAIQQSVAGMSPADATQVRPQLAGMENVMASPEGRAGFWAFAYSLNSIFLLLFGVGGGVLGARLMGRMRRPEV